MPEKLEVVWVGDGIEDGSGPSRGASGPASSSSVAGGGLIGPPARDGSSSLSSLAKTDDSMRRAGQSIANEFRDAFLGGYGLTSAIQDITQKVRTLYGASADVSRSSWSGQHSSGSSSMPPGPPARGSSVGSMLAGPAAQAAITGSTSYGAEAAAIGPAASSAATSLAGVAATAVPLTVGLTALLGSVYAVKLGLAKSIQDIETLSQYSGPLSQANAMGEVRRELAEMRRADRLGPQLADFSDIMSRGQDKLYSVQTEIMAGVLKAVDKLAPALEKVIASGDVVAAAIAYIVENAEASTKRIETWFNWSEQTKNDFIKEQVEANVALGKVYKSIQEFGKKADESRDDPFIGEFYASLGEVGEPNKPPPAPAGGMPGHIPNNLPHVFPHN